MIKFRLFEIACTTCMSMQIWARLARVLVLLCILGALCFISRQNWRSAEDDAALEQINAALKDITKNRAFLKEEKLWTSK